MSYYEKYLKYKNKYLELKSKIGGSMNSNCDNLQLEPTNKDIIHFLQSIKNNINLAMIDTAIFNYYRNNDCNNYDKLKPLIDKLKKRLIDILNGDDIKYKILGQFNATFDINKITSLNELKNEDIKQMYYLTENGNRVLTFNTEQICKSLELKTECLTKPQHTKPLNIIYNSVKMDEIIQENLKEEKQYKLLQQKKDAENEKKALEWDNANKNNFNKINWINPYNGKKNRFHK
jgi:hypothetical protein